MKVVYPGSFDPITNGHLDIIERAAKKFDKVVVAVLNNNSKSGLFTLNEKIRLLRESVSYLSNVEIDSFSGLLIDYAGERGIRVVIRGLRAVSDFEYEMQMALANKKLSSDLETFFMVSSSEYAFLSSSIVKEIAAHGGDVSTLVPSVVEKALKTKYEEVHQ